jgi:lipopolysaccharide/colanic/teichoic acid biosynthesis glycosyltransferase
MRDVQQSVPSVDRRCPATEYSDRTQEPSGSFVVSPSTVVARHFGSGDAVRWLEYQRLPYWTAKHIVDRISAALIVGLLMPLFVAIGLLLILEARLPILYWQKLVAANGKSFRQYRFRTLLASRGCDGRRRADGERIGPVGRHLRRAGLDRLPLLLNIVFGQMSIVGVRSGSDLLAEECGLRPGLISITDCFAEYNHSARNLEALEGWYLRHASFGVDAAILVNCIAPNAIRHRFQSRLLFKAQREMWGTQAHPKDSGIVNVAAP